MPLRVDAANCGSALAAFNVEVYRNNIVARALSRGVELSIENVHVTVSCRDGTVAAKPSGTRVLQTGEDPLLIIGVTIDVSSQSDGDLVCCLRSVSLC